MKKDDDNELFKLKKPVEIDFSDLTALAVGQYVMTFASLEAAINQAIAKLLHTDDANPGAIVTAQQGFTAKLELLGALHKYRCSLKSERAAVDKLINDCRQAAEVRNRMMHADWPLSFMVDKPFMKIVRAKAKDGLRVELVNISQAGIAKRAAEAAALTMRIHERFGLYGEDSGLYSDQD